MGTTLHTKIELRRIRPFAVFEVRQTYVAKVCRNSTTKTYSRVERRVLKRLQPKTVEQRLKLQKAVKYAAVKKRRL